MKIIKNRVFKTLIVIFVLGFFLGIISFIFMKSNNSSIISYFESIKNDKFNYGFGLLNSIIYNYKYLIIIWILGIIFIFSIFVPFIELFRGISIGFTISLIIYTFNIKGLLISLILLFPCILINEIIYLLESFYSINMSLKLYNSFKNNKSITLKYYFKNYFYQFLIFLCVLFISSLFEVYITSNILKYVL